MPNAIGVGLPPTPVTAIPGTQYPEAAPGSSFLPPVVPSSQLHVTPYTGPSTPSGLAPPQYSTGPNQLSVGTAPGQQQQNSAISDFTAQLESGGGLYAGDQPATMVDKTYGQYRLFQKQYGAGAAGVDNYVAQILKANPNATLGDYYSGYVLGTGDPSKLPGMDALKDQNPKAYNNLQKQMAAHGYNANTPLSSLTGTSAGQQQVVGISEDGYPIYASAPTTKADPNQPLKPATTNGYSESAAGGPTPEQVQAKAQSDMMKMQMAAMLRGWALHPVPYDPAAILKVSHIYGEPDTRITGRLPEIANVSIPKLQLAQPLSALTPSRVPGKLQQRGPDYSS